jgi:hypothetical protein
MPTTRRTSTRQILRDNAATTGWACTESFIFDVFTRDDIKVIVGWSSSDRDNDCFGTYKVIGAPEDTQTAMDELAIPQARAWINEPRETQTPAPVEAS